MIKARKKHLGNRIAELVIRISCPTTSKNAGIRGACT